MRPADLNFNSFTDFPMWQRWHANACPYQCAIAVIKSRSDISQRCWASLSAEQDHLQDAASGRKAAGAAHLQQVRQE